VVVLFYPDCSNNNWGSEVLTNAGQQGLYSFLSQLGPQGFAGMCHKMTQGSGFIDPYGALAQTWCDQNNLPFIGYHYVDTSDPNAQAQNWLAAGGRTNAMFDWEANSGDLNTFWAVTNAFNAAGINVQLAYDPRWYLEGAGSGAGTDISEFAADGILLVSSAYPLGSQAGFASDLYAQCGGDTGPGWAPYDGGPPPSAWQFTSSANIAGFSLVDANAYLGTDINVLFGTAPAPIPTPAPTPTPTPTPPAPTPTTWTLPDDDSIFAAAGVIVAQFLGSGNATVGNG
jgi:hypothetical protein